MQSEEYLQVFDSKMVVHFEKYFSNAALSKLLQNIFDCIEPFQVYQLYERIFIRNVNYCL